MQLVLASNNAKKLAELGLLFAPRALRDLGTNAFAARAAAPIPQPR